MLQVIEYIQFLQEKVNRYESSYNVWNQEPTKMMHWVSSNLYSYIGLKCFVGKQADMSGLASPKHVLGINF